MPNTCEDLGSVGPQHQGETKWQRVEGEKKGRNRERKKEGRKKVCIHIHTSMYTYMS